MTVVDVGLIISQGNESAGAMPFGTAMGFASIAALVAEVISDVAMRGRLMAFSAFMFAVVGALGIFTIGLAFLVAAGLAAIGFVGKPQNLSREEVGKK